MWPFYRDRPRPVVNCVDFQIADGLANSCGGVLRGQGRQHLGAVFNLVAYYVLALPLGLALAFNFNQGEP
jgi:MATE family multidrug resistance protein